VGIFVGLIMIAFGAILTWAVNAEVQGLDVTAVGVILLILGIILVLLDMLWWRSWTYGPWATTRSATYVEGGPAAPAAGWGRRRRVVVDEAAPGPPPGPPGPPPP
jgi:hypothetical protein